MLPSPREPRDDLARAAFEPPYPPGWFDRLIDWIDRRPEPNAVWALGLLVVQSAWLSAVGWLGGRAPAGRFDLAPLLVAA
jgi:hypothetical protein